MSSGLIAKRYAKALFRLCDEQPEKAKRHLPSLEAMEAVFATEDGGKVLGSPVMPMDLKRELLGYAMKIGGADKQLEGLLEAIFASGRVPIIPEISEAFKELLLEAEGVVSAEVCSATPLDDAQVKDIGAKMGAVLGKKVVAHGTVDADLLGGFLVKVGNYKVDMSLKSRIETLAQSAAGA